MINALFIVVFFIAGDEIAMMIDLLLHFFDFLLQLLAVVLRHAFESFLVGVELIFYLDIVGVQWLRYVMVDLLGPIFFCRTALVVANFLLVEDVLVRFLTFQIVVLIVSLVHYLDEGLLFLRFLHWLLIWRFEDVDAWTLIL